MLTAEKNGIVDRITGVAERATAGTDIEIVEVQLRGGGKARLLRVYIDKPGGVTHGDCELVSERLGKRLDEEDIVPGDSYTLEVSSPGVERNLLKPRDFQRVVGQKIRLALQEPIQGRKHLEGKLAQIAADALELEIAPGDLVHIPFEQVQKAKLKFEW
ncbi:MAG TPA: ribosome maturation factor RimP [Bryobacteraceae bacterium]|nr:ribosome maturation factor RimP [Bryobacteraceae bacterium]